MRAGGAVDHQGLPADGLEGADRAVDAAHEQLLGLAKNLLRTASRTMCHWIPSANDLKRGRRDAGVTTLVSKSPPGGGDTNEILRPTLAKPANTP